jgi:uncharacterized protein (DUF58 family)
MSGRLSPPVCAGIGEPSGRLPVALGTRALMLLTAGLLWLLPAWFDHRAIVVMVAWNVAVVAAAAIDVRRLPAPGQLALRRRWSGALTLGVPVHASIEVHNRGTAPIDVQITDYVAASLRPDLAELRLYVGASGVAAGTYHVVPRERGDVVVGPTALRWQGAWRLAERRGIVRLQQDMRVYPGLEEGRRESLYLIRSHQKTVERRRARRAAMAREFESLRDYQPGDEPRDICWTAAARRGRLVTKVHRPERSQSVWILVDAGRLLRARAGPWMMIDHLVTAALTLAQVAMSSGDRVGLLAYGRRIQRRMAPSRGAAHLRALVEALAGVHADNVEADHRGAAAEMLRLQKRRALVVWLTDIAETAGVPDVIEQTASMVPRHVLLFAVARHPEMPALAAAAPGSPADMYRVMAAQEALERREALLRGLQQRGALVLEGSPADLGAGLVNRYLEVKGRGLL